MMGLPPDIIKEVDDRIALRAAVEEAAVKLGYLCVSTTLHGRGTTSFEFRKEDGSALASYSIIDQAAIGDENGQA